MFDFSYKKAGVYYEKNIFINLSFNVGYGQKY